MSACRRVLALAALLLATAQVQAAALRFEIGAIDHAAFALRSLSLSVSDDGSRAELRIAQLSVGEHAWTKVVIDCPRFRAELPLVECVGGELRASELAEPLALTFRYDLRSRAASVEVYPAERERVSLTFSDGVMQAGFAHFALGRLLPLMPALAGHSPTAAFDGQVRLDRDGRVSVAGQLSDGAFASADGLQAAEGLTLAIEGELRPEALSHSFSARIEWRAGQAYMHPVYVTAPAALRVEGRWGADRLELSRVALSLDGARAIEARATLSLPDGTPQRLALAVASADLAVLGPRFVAPLLAPARAQALSFDGQLSAGVVFEGGRLRSVDAAFDAVRFEDADTALAFGPLSGSVPWREDAPTRIELQVGGGRWEALELGAFELVAEVHGERFDVARVEVPLLDGRLVLNDLALRRDEAGWHGSGGAVVEPVSMPLLTRAVGLPEMAGVLSASLPGLRVSPGELALDGALVVSVFDGYLRLTDLRVLEPFGVSSRLFSNVMARNLDLAQLTQTFSFGGMSGFVDIDIDELELADWRPLRFDARVASSPGRYARRISQRAVENIGALAGPGAGLALQRSFLRFFESFGYREIGLKCRLENGVCTMGGIGDERSGAFDIVRGGGIPALNIIGYNRRVDWEEFVGRVQRVIESNAAPVIR